MIHVTLAPDLMPSRIRPALFAAFGFYLAAVLLEVSGARVAYRFGGQLLDPTGDARIVAGLAAAVAFAWAAASLGVEAARRDGGPAESLRLTLAAWVATLAVLPFTPTALVGWWAMPEGPGLVDHLARTAARSAPWTFTVAAIAVVTAALAPRVRLVEPAPRGNRLTTTA